MRSLSVAGKILKPGATIQVPVGNWDAQSARWEEMGLLKRLNPNADDLYYVQSCYRAGKTLKEAPAPPEKPKKSSRRKR